MSAMLSQKPKVAVLIPQEKRDLVFRSEAEETLATFADPFIATDQELAQGDISKMLHNVPAVITGWLSPPIPKSAFAPSGSVKFLSHTAGSVRKLGVQGALEAGEVRVSHAASVIAYAVAEFTLTQMLAHVRRHRDTDAGFRNGTPWFDIRENFLGQLLSAQEVGIVGLGYVGRLVLDLLRPFGCPISVYDPFVDQVQALTLGVTLRPLEELFRRCSIVTLHAAKLPETERMITRAHLDLLRPGSLLVNTARAQLIEEGAILDVLREGKIFAALDTFEKEPGLGQDMPPKMREELQRLPNLYASPHCAGHTSDSYIRQGLSAVEEVRRFLAGERLNQEISREKAPMLA
ncbi:MAG: hydroxyacid dehydrogenase [Pseudomonadota bacterium]